MRIFCFSDWLAVDRALDKGQVSQSHLPSGSMVLQAESGYLKPPWPAWLASHSSLPQSNFDPITRQPQRKMRKRSNTTRSKDQSQTNKQARRDSNVSFSEGATPIHAGLGEQFSLATLHESACVADGSSSSPSTNREEYAFTGSNSASSSSVQVCEYISAPTTCGSREFCFRRRVKTQKSLGQLAKG